MLEDLVRAGRSAGAHIVEAGFEHARTRRLQGLRHPPVSADRVLWSVRVWDDAGRSGAGSAEDASDALGRAMRSLRDDAAPGCGPTESPALRGASGIEDPRLVQISDVERMEVLANAERALGTHRRHALRYEEHSIVRAWASSRGASLHERGSAFALEVAVDGPLGVTRETVAARRFADVASRPLGLTVRRRADVAALPAVLPASAPMVMEPRTFAAVLDAIATDAARRPVRGADRQAAWPGTLTVVDNGSLRNGLRTRGFDARGVAPVPVPLLVAGGPGAGYRTDSEGTPTGHTGTDGRLVPSNVVANPGIRTRNMLTADLSEWVLVDVLPPYDADAGTFAGELRLCVVRGGERTGMVRRTVRIALADVLAELVEVGADEERHAHVDAVSARFSPGLLARVPRDA